MIKLKGQNDSNGFYKMGLIDWVQIFGVIGSILALSLLIVYSH